MVENNLTCKVCGRAFHSEESLSHHIRDRHERAQENLVRQEAEKLAQSQREKEDKLVLQLKEKRKDKRKIIMVFIGIISLAIIIFIGYQFSLNAKERKEDLRLQGIPSEPIHWHPHLTIIIDDETQSIPTDIGISSNIHYPIHTHETDGTIHMENNNPNSENVRLGYFFKIWGKTFNEQCIFDFCTDETHELKMYVNGEENTKYGEYIMRDKDEIKIEYREMS